MNDASGNADIAASIEALRQRLLASMTKPLDLDAGFDPAEAMKSLTAGLIEDAGRWQELQSRYYRKQLELWSAFSAPDAAAQKSAETESDRRFRAPEWRSQPYFEYRARSYLLSAQWLRARYSK